MREYADANRRARLEGGGGRASRTSRHTHGRQCEWRPPITSYPPTCGQARWWGMKYGATGVALHGTCARRRAARVRGQCWAAAPQRLSFFDKCRPDCEDFSSSNFAPRPYFVRKGTKVTKMRSSPIRASLFSNRSRKKQRQEDGRLQVRGYSDC